jgi:NAD-dependent DNA ligase
MSSADTELASIEQKKSANQQKLNEFSDGYKLKKAELKKFEQQIDEKSVQKLYKILDKKCPEALGKMVESMVALLRGQK